VSQARLIRAKNYMANGFLDPAIADYKILAEDNITEYGAQGTVELAQHLSGATPLECDGKVMKPKTQD